MVGIIIITYNLDSRIFLLQQAAIKKFCKDEYEINIIDNSSDDIMAEAIRYHSEQLGLNYIKTFAGGMGSDSHAFAANLSYGKFKHRYTHFLFLDHDAIPVKEFSVVNILGDKVMGGIAQGINKTYFWPGCFMFSAEKIDREIIDFHPDNTLGLDTGGSLYKAIEIYGKESCIFFDEAYYQNPYFNSSKYDHYAMIYKGTFLHCIGMSNWIALERHEERLNALINVITEKING